LNYPQVYNDDLEEDNSDWEEGEGGDDDEDEDSDIDEADGEANESAASVNANDKEVDKPGKLLKSSQLLLYIVLIYLNSQKSRKPGARRESMMVKLHGSTSVSSLYVINLNIHPHKKHTHIQQIQAQILQSYSIGF